MADHIVNAGNTQIPAYLTLQSKGYRVCWKRGDSTADEETWFAEGPLGSFQANGPVELLGLVAVRELRGAAWKASDDEVDEFMAKYDA